MLGSVLAQLGITASCLGWLLTPEPEGQEILQGPGQQGHSLTQWRGPGWEFCGPSSEAASVSSDRISDSYFFILDKDFILHLRKVYIMLVEHLDM